MEGLSLFFISTNLCSYYHQYIYNKLHSKDSKKSISSSSIADDNCLSLFYNKNIGVNGTGIPFTNTIESVDINNLKTTFSDYKRLDMDLYRNVVEKLPIVCVDVLCKRKSDNKLLLFYRRDAPAASIWWWPGGRMFRGESFFDTAIRKVKDETGTSNIKVTPIGIVSVWNTFFPDSAWDKKRLPGHEGTQTVNVTVVVDIDDSETKIDFKTSAGKDWAVEAHRWISVSEGLVPGDFDKYVRLNIELALKLELLNI